MSSARIKSRAFFRNVIYKLKYCRDGQGGVCLFLDSRPTSALNYLISLIIYTICHFQPHFMTYTAADECFNVLVLLHFIVT